MAELELPKMFSRLPEHLRSRVLGIWRTTRPFREFAQQHEGKIWNKISRPSDPEDVADMIAEFETAGRLLRCEGFVVEYEPFGKAGVDFRVSRENAKFHVETKRVREDADTVLFRKSLTQIITAVREVQAPLGVSIVFDGIDPGPGLARDLDEAIVEVAREAVEIVTSLSSRLQGDESRRVPLAAFPDLHLIVKHIPNKRPETPVANLGPVSPLFYRQTEHRKFSDRILDAIKQFRSGSPNVVVFVCDSMAHYPIDLRFGVEELRQSIQDREEALFRRKGFEDSSEVKTKFRLLTAAVVLSRSRPVQESSNANTVWVHPTPETPIPDEIQEILKGL